jgi:glycosyltransferase involved in cell wall biosynthesis
MNTQITSTKVGVIIATKGRPEIISRTVAWLQHQTRVPEIIVVAASEKRDVDEATLGSGGVEVIFGPPGLTKQRNNGLDLIQSKVDYVVFFDDDFIPSRFWIERLCELAATWPDVACVSGHVIADGIKGPGYSWSIGEDLVRKQDDKAEIVRITSCRRVDGWGPYGCNMAFRADAIGETRLDERLVLYGWQEDMDFGYRVAKRGRRVWTDFLWGVHLGIKAGRMSGVRFGYSQVVNPLYLRKKGTMSFRKAATLITRNVIANCARTIWFDPLVDRPGRLKGNLLGFADWLRGSLTPERAERL